MTCSKGILELTNTELLRETQDLNKVEPFLNNGLSLDYQFKELCIIEDF